MTTRVLITGTSGTGKSSVIQELAARGHQAVDADLDGLSEVIESAPDELTGLGDGRDWVWVEDRIHEVLARDDVDLLFLGGCSPNQGGFYHRFDHVVLLTASPEVIAARLTTRATNVFGKRRDERARSLALQQQVEPLLRAGADLEIVTTAPLSVVVEQILDHVRRPPHR